MKVVHKGFVLVAVPLIFMGGVLASTLWLANTEEKLLLAEARSKRVTALSADIAGRVLNCRAAVALYALTHSSSYLKPLQSASTELPAEVNLLEGTVSDDIIEKQYVAALRQKTAALLQACNDLAVGVADGKQDHVVGQLQNQALSADVHELNTLVDHIRLRELYFTGNRPSEIVLFRQKFQNFVVLAAGLGAVIASMMAYFFATQISYRLLRLRQNADLLAKEENLLPPMSGSDELAHVDRAFHSAALALKESETLRRQFLAMVTHDLRSPLASISLVLQTLAYGCYGKLPEDANRALDDAHESANRLLRLINSLLTVDKIVSGTLEINKAECDFKEVVQASVQDVMALAKERQITIETNVQDVSVDADKDRLSQVVVNLLANAIKFSPAGSKIEVNVSSLQRGEVKVEVVDSGRGIPAAQIDRVFDRYVQIKAEDAIKGSGLGLPICKAIVEGHGGKIGVDSVEGKGSTFWFALPATSHVLEAAATQKIKGG
ncbi:MAG TPA: ATP-binding protein [Candidatus Obscuribacterales bacterium]